MKKILLLLSILFMFSCEENEIMPNEDNALSTKPTNYELIQDNLQEFLRSSDNQRMSSNLYYCSEVAGGYNNLNLVNKGYYLNSYYVPNPGTVAKFSDLQSLLTYRYSDPGLTGTNPIYVNISFDIYTDGTFLTQTEANRVYNEFICQLNEQVGTTGNSSRPEYNLSFTLDYLLCCNGSSCCYPIFYASGVVYP